MLISHTEISPRCFGRSWLLAGIAVLEVTEEASRLAAKYIGAGAFSLAMQNDAVHVATASVTGKQVLVSWNFRHLVNRRRRAMVCSVNLAEGLTAIEILSPPEL